MMLTHTQTWWTRHFPILIVILILILITLLSNIYILHAQTDWTCHIQHFINSYSYSKYIYIDRLSEEVCSCNALWCIFQYHPYSCLKDWLLSSCAKFRKLKNGESKVLLKRPNETDFNWLLHRLFVFYLYFTCVYLCFLCVYLCFLCVSLFFICVYLCLFVFYLCFNCVLLKCPNETDFNWLLHRPESFICVCALGSHYHVDFPGEFSYLAKFRMEDRNGNSINET